MAFGNLKDDTRWSNALAYLGYSDDGKLQAQRITGIREVRCLEDLTVDGQPIVGFIYRITDRVTGKLYIGQKSVTHKTKKKATLKEKAAALALNKNSRIKVTRGVKDSGWAKYWGSNRTLQADVELHGALRFCREIIELCCSKKYLGFAEVEHMFKHDVLRRSDSYNDNILGRFYRKDLLNCPES